VMGRGREKYKEERLMFRNQKRMSRLWTIKEFSHLMKSKRLLILQVRQKKYLIPKQCLKMKNKKIIVNISLILEIKMLISSVKK